MFTDSVPDSARSLARLSLAFEDMAADIRRGAEARGLVLSEVRLLDGIARGLTGARDLSRQLRLDEGHVSRTVRRLREAGLLTATRQQGDSRRIVLALTEAGHARLHEAIDGAADAASAALGEGMAAAAPAVVTALRSVLNGKAPTDHVVISGLRPGDAGWVIAQHGALYARDEVFDQSFELAVARIVADFLGSHDPSREAAWIARAGDQPVGCIFCVTAADDSGLAAQLRLFLVRPEWRGRGLGRRLLDTCRDFAAGAGYCDLMLRTHVEHEAACRLYQDYGFTPTGTRPVKAYGRDLTEQIWALPLDGALAKDGARV